MEIFWQGLEWLSMGSAQLSAGADRAENRCRFDVMLPGSCRQKVFYSATSMFQGKAGIKLQTILFAGI